MSSGQAQPDSRPTILVVDDDRDARESVEDGLRDSRYQPVCVANGDEALAYLRRNPAPAAILLDLFMPVMNGWQFVRHVRGTPFESIPIVLVTGSEPYWGYPVARVLRKPLDIATLLPVLSEIVGPGVAA